MVLNDPAKIFLRRVMMLEALLASADPTVVGERFGMTRKQVGNTLSGLWKLGFLNRVESAPPANAPAYIKHTVRYTLKPEARALVERLRSSVAA